MTRTIVVGDTVVGDIGSWLDDGRRQVGYWIGREHWGRGYATDALRLLLAEIPDRPVFAPMSLSTTSDPGASSSIAGSSASAGAVAGGRHRRVDPPARLTPGARPERIEARSRIVPPRDRSARRPRTRTPHRRDARDRPAPSPTRATSLNPRAARSRLLPVPGRRARRVHRPDAAQRGLETGHRGCRQPCFRGDLLAPGHRPDDHLPASAGVEPDRRGRRRPLASGTKTVGELEDTAGAEADATAEPAPDAASTDDGDTSPPQDAVRQ